MIKIMPEGNATWYAAVSTKLVCSGFGQTKKEALESLRRSIKSINKNGRVTAELCKSSQH